MVEILCNICNETISGAYYLHHLKEFHKEYKNSNIILCPLCNEPNKKRSYNALLKHLNSIHIKQLFTNTEYYPYSKNANLDDILKEYYSSYHPNDKQMKGLFKLIKNLETIYPNKELKNDIEKSFFFKALNNKHELVEEICIKEEHMYYRVNKKNILRKLIDEIDHEIFINDKNYCNVLIYGDGVNLGNPLIGNQKNTTQLHLCLKLLPNDVHYPFVNSSKNLTTFTLGITPEKKITPEELKKIVFDKIKEIEQITLTSNRQIIIKFILYIISGDNVFLQQIHNRNFNWSNRGNNVACRLCNIPPNQYSQNLTTFHVQNKICKNNNIHSIMKRPFCDVFHDFTLGVLSYTSYLKNSEILSTLCTINNITVLLCNITKAIHDYEIHSTVQANILKQNVNCFYQQFFKLLPDFPFSLKYHLLLHLPYVVQNSGHLSNISCMSLESYHQTLKRESKLFKGGKTFEKTLLSKVALHQKIDTVEDNACEIVIKKWRNYNYEEIPYKLEETTPLNKTMFGSELFDYSLDKVDLEDDLMEL